MIRVRIDCQELVPAPTDFYKPRQLSRVLDKDAFTKDELVAGMTRLVKIFEEHRKDNPGPTDRTAKSAEFREFLLDRLAPAPKGKST